MTDAITYFENHPNDWGIIVSLMDDQLREAVYWQEHETTREFLAAYCRLHEEEFGQKFVIS